MKFLKSLQFKLAIFFTLLALTPTLLVGIFSYSVLQQSLLNTAKENARDMASLKMSSFDLTASSIELALTELAVAETTQAYLQLRYNKQSDAYYRNLLFITAKIETLMTQRGDSIRTAAFLWNDGEVPLVRGDPSSLRLYGDYRESSLFSMFDQSSATIRWLHVVDDYGTSQIYVYKPLYSPASDSVGVIVFHFYSDFVNKFFRTQNGPGSFDVLLDGNSTKIMSPHNNYSELTDILVEIQTLPIINGNREIRAGENNRSFLVTSVVSSVNTWQYVLCDPLENVRESTGAITFVVLIVILGATAGAVLAGMFLYRYINKPIQKLSVAMGKLQQGDLSVRVSSTRTDELGLLGTGFNQMVEETLNLIEGIKQEQERKRETEIRFLQAQISPHFLYNTLNASKVLARQGRSEDVVDMITAIISLLHLISNEKEFITLNREVTFIQNYISIMEYRKEGRYNLSVDIDKEAANCLIPKFTLQPIVENSIIHGFAGKDGDCNIRLEAYVSNSILDIKIADNGVGFYVQEQVSETDDKHFRQVGVQNVDERLKQNYGSEYGLTLESTPGTGTVAKLSLPADYTDAGNTE